MAAATLSSALTQLTYGVGRWGTGELVLRGDRPVHHELPWPARVPSRVLHIDAEDIADRRPANAAERYIKAFARYLSGRRVNFDPEAFGLDETCDEMGMTELEAVPGVPAAVGRRIYDHLHRVGGDGPTK